MVAGGMSVNVAIKRRWSSMGLVIALVVNLLLSGMGALPVHASGVSYKSGDVLAGVGTGRIKHFSASGTLLDTLDTGRGCSDDLGMAFDSANNLYSTVAFRPCFGAGKVFKFDSQGNLVGPFGSGYSDSTESITIDGYGDIYVGQSGGTHRLLKFSSTGSLLASFSPAIEDRGTDWIDIAADQCTLYYTSGGFLIKRFNVCTNTQLPDFATLPSAPAYALRLRPNGEVMVAATSAVYRLNAAGQVIQTYPKPAAEWSFLFALNLDPNGTSFWTAGYNSGNIYKFDIASGAVETSFNGGVLGCCMSGLAVSGEIVVAQGTAGLVTGSGHLPGTIAGADANFGFSVHRKAIGKPVTGQLEYRDKGANLNVHSTAMKALSVSGNTATFGGTASINGKGSYSFTVTVQDYGEPAAGHDTFSISLSNGYTNHGTLSGGNVNIHAATVPAPFITSIAPSGGPLAGGTDVKIKGSDFVKGATVSIGGSSALSVKVVNAHSITATTPPSALGVQAVLVTNPDGQSYALAPSSLCVTCGFYYHN